MNTTIGKNTIGAELLRGFVDRVESINAQIKQLGQDKAVVLAEAKAANLVPAAINFIVKKRKMKPSQRSEAEALEDMYMHAMGMAGDTPLFRAVGLMKVDITSRESVIDAMKKFVPANGSITVEAGGAPVRLTRDGEGNISVTEVIEKPVQQELPKTGKRGAPPKAEVPDVTPAVAESMGRQAFKDDVPIINNPFPFGDARRPLWDRGWRDESGGDGMGD
jgi:uncharacterized protein (UPF0335 family)